MLLDAARVAPKYRQPADQLCVTNQRLAKSIGTKDGKTFFDSTEDSKRKRGIEEAEKIFKKSKKLIKSPTSSENMEMNEVTEMLNK